MTAPPNEPDWGDRIEDLRRPPARVAALRSADLLELAKTRWEGKVVPRLSHDDLLFTRLGDSHPFPRFARVSFSPAEGTYTFTLETTVGIVTADTTFPATAPVVLDAFLMQLVGDDI